MPGRNRRTQFDFTIGPGLREQETRWILLQASAQLTLARHAVKEAERAKALARLDAANECLEELRNRDDRLRLW